MPEIRIIPFTPEYAGELGQLHWQVWDYSEETYNLLGQVCLPFCLIWYALCIPVALLSLRLNNR